MIRMWEMTNCHFSRFIDKRGVRPSYKNLSIYVLCPHERAWYKSDPFPSRTTFQEFLIIALPWLSIQLNWPVKTHISYLTVKHTLSPLSWKLLKNLCFCFSSTECVACSLRTQPRPKAMSFLELSIISSLPLRRPAKTMKVSRRRRRKRRKLPNSTKRWAGESLTFIGPFNCQFNDQFILLWTEEKYRKLKLVWSHTVSISLVLI